MSALLAGCSRQENEIGDINNYTPIALLDDAVVYNYTPLYNFISKNSVSSIDVSRPQQ